MGPVAYFLNAIDLRPIDQDNIFKYADNTYLIVSDSNIPNHFNGVVTYF